MRTPVLAAVLAVALSVFASAPASATPLTWMLDNVLFSDGTAVTGSFVYDADTDAWSSLSLTTSGGSSVGARSDWVFDTLLAGALQNSGTTSGFLAVAPFSPNLTGASLVSLFSLDGQLMTNAGGTISLEFMEAGTCAVADCATLNPNLPFTNSGSGNFVSANNVPEPATLLLLASGLAGLAGLGWRKN